MSTPKQYLRQFEEWGTALRRRYSEDPFLRTTVRTIFVQSAVVFACIIASWWLAAHAEYHAVAFLGVGLIAIVSIVFSILLARYTLRITQNTENHQRTFISNVAHELRTPLSIIKTSTEVELLDETLSPSTRTTLIHTVGELNRISEIINNLLSLNSLTRPEPMRFKKVDLGTIVEVVLRNFKALAQKYAIQLHYTKNIHLRTEVWGNALALEQVVTALVQNAINYTPKNTHGTVTVSLEQTEQGLLTLSIRDSGIGISKKDLSHIFVPFYRVDTSRVRSVKKGGAGLGLTVVSEIVQAHKGKIHIQSIEHKGTDVSVFLSTRSPHQIPKITRLV